MNRSKALLLAFTCMSIVSCKHATQSEQVDHDTPPDIKLEDAFYPTAPGAEYHPRANRPPPFWPPHEHVIEPIPGPEVPWVRLPALN